MHKQQFGQYSFLNFYYSPHRNYSLLRYPCDLGIPSRITICRGDRFENGFLTYIGCVDESGAEDMMVLVEEWGGYFRHNERFARPSDRLFHRDRIQYPLEIKARRLPLSDVIEIAEHWTWA